MCMRNPVVQKGLTWEGFRWALTYGEIGHWHPLTWLSHMLDCQLYGLNAGGHHLTNVLLHTAAAILLFLVLRRMTGFCGAVRSWRRCLPFIRCGWNRWLGSPSARMF